MAIRRIGNFLVPSLLDYKELINCSNIQAKSVKKLIFIVGEVASGKSLLLNELINRIEKKVYCKILSDNASFFVQNFVKSIELNEISSFTNNLLEFDVIALDNFEMINLLKKPATRAELFSLFNKCLSASVTIIITSAKTDFLNLVESEFYHQLLIINLDLKTISDIKFIEDTLKKKYFISDSLDLPDYKDFRELEGYLKTEAFKLSL